MEIIKTAQFDEVISSGTVLVDFFAEWCGPCKMIMPELEKLANEYQGKAKIVKVNVDEDPDLAVRYDVTSIPNLIVFKNGEIVNRALGWQSALALKNLVESGL